MSKYPYPDEWTAEADRECRSAARGLGFVMLIALGYVAAVLGYAGVRWWLA